MPTDTISDVSCIVGVGETAYTRGTDKSELSLLLEASCAALRDAGLAATDIDGIIGPPAGHSAEHVAANLGISDLRYTATVAMGGASMVAALKSAAMAIAAGTARNVLIPLGWKGYSERRVSRGGAPEFLAIANTVGSYYLPLGAISPAQYYAWLATRHMETYSNSSDHTASYEAMAAISLNSRRNAQLNEKALTRGMPLTRDDYFSSRWISRPFRLFDCCLETDGGCAVIVSRADQAKDLRHTPVYITGIGEGHPYPADEIAGRPEFLKIGLDSAAPAAFGMAGLNPADVDFLEIYDCFSYVVMLQLEAMGFCGRGEAKDFVTDERIGLAGSLPINTHGGLHSEAHAWALNHVNEAVRQLRSTCGDRHVKNARVGGVTGWGDFGDGALAILTTR